MKKRRHEKILQLIGSHMVDTQEELLRLLREEGYEVTQATVSRDIKELRLVKTQTGNGRYRYTAPKTARATFPPAFSRCFLKIQFPCRVPATLW